MYLAVRLQSTRVYRVFGSTWNPYVNVDWHSVGRIPCGTAKRQAFNNLISHHLHIRFAFKIVRNRNSSPLLRSSRARLHLPVDVVVCLHADKSSPTIGLRNFVMPLRASSFHRNELPTIIFVTDLDYIRNEWDMICTFPDIYILNVITRTFECRSSHTSALLARVRRVIRTTCS